MKFKSHEIMPYTLLYGTYTIITGKLALKYGMESHRMLQPSHSVVGPPVLRR